MRPWEKEVAVACRVHARLHNINGQFPWLPLRQICPIYLGFSAVIFPPRRFHCSPGVGRVSRKGFWSKQGSAVEAQPKVFWKSTMEEEF